MLLMPLSPSHAQGASSSTEDNDAMAPALEAYRAGRYEQALLIATPLAEKGNVSAQLMLGSIYNNGEGITPNPEEAAKWFAKAAAKGEAGAQYALGMLMEYGRVDGADRQIYTV